MIGKIQTWLAQRNYIALMFVFLLFPVMSQAGGLGIAMIVAIAGIWGLTGFRLSWFAAFVKLAPMPIWCLLLFLLWAFVSSTWSPYNSGDTLSNAQKMSLGVPLYFGFAFMVKNSARSTQDRLTQILFITTIGSAFAVLVDLLSGYSISLAVSPPAIGEDPNFRNADTIQNLGHAASVLVLVAVPVSILLWLKGGKYRIACLILTALVLVCTLASGLAAGTLAASIAAVFVLAAIKKPALMMRASFMLAGASLLFAPVAAFLASKTSAETKAMLPFSWEERVENWGYVYNKILEHPLRGHGFDAVRTFNDTHTIRGFEGRALVSLHPHNAGLHLWTEVGMIGVNLACLCLYFAMRYLLHMNGALGRVSKWQMVAISGLVAASTIISCVTYGVWQDWWWATIIFAASLIFLIRD